MKKLKTKKEESKKELNIINIIKEDEDINKLKKIILKDNTQMYITIILEYIELKKKIYSSWKVNHTNWRTWKKKNVFEAEYKLEEHYYNL